VSPRGEPAADVTPARAGLVAKSTIPVAPRRPPTMNAAVEMAASVLAESPTVMAASVQRR